jgi:hypothetical protein
VRPQDYPWEPVREPSLLVGGRLVPLRAPPAGAPRASVPRQVPIRWAEIHVVAVTPTGRCHSLGATLRGLGGEGMAAREPVLAVGSNASARVLSDKLRRRRVSTTVPMWPVVVRNLAVGHSAHRSVPGYVPAAPWHSHGTSSQVVLLWLDRRQLAAVDRTEPNYRRVWLRDREYPTEGVHVDGFWVYESRWGVLADRAGEEALLLTSQVHAERSFAAAGGAPGSGTAAGVTLLSAGTPSPRRRRRTW